MVTYPKLPVNNRDRMFWLSGKRRLQKFNGVSEHTFYLHLKECEYRFNQRKENLFRLLLKLLQRHLL